MKCEATEPL